MANKMYSNNYKETFETWNKVALLYQDKFMNLDIYNESYDFFCAAFSKQQPHILEIACGPGNITKYLLKVRPDFQITAIDIAPAMIELAQKNNPTVHFKVMDAREISILNTNYDGIIAGFCLPYLSETDCSELLNNCSNLINTGGYLYLSFVEGGKEKSGYQTGSSGDRVYFYYHQQDNLTELLLKNGFEKPYVFKVLYKKTEEFSDEHTILISKKIS